MSLNLGYTPFLGPEGRARDNRDNSPIARVPGVYNESYGPEPTGESRRELLSASPASVVLKGARALQYRQRIVQSHRGTLVRRCATRRGIVVIVVVPVWSGPAVSLVRLPVLGGSTVVHQNPHSNRTVQSGP